MQKIHILVICCHKEILETILRLIHKNENWEAKGTSDIEKAVELFVHQAFDLVLLGSGISEADEKKLQSIFLKLNPQIKIIQHYGGGSGLLFNEIEAAITSNENGNFTILDNPFDKK